MNMPFGKYKGRPLRLLPSDYVTWLGTIELTNELATALEQIYGRKFTRREQSQATPSNTEISIGPALNSMRRRFAAKYHPDRTNGDALAMRIVNDVFDVLEKELAS